MAGVNLDQLKTFLRLLESNQDGEVLNAARMIAKLAAKNKKNVAELIEEQFARERVVIQEKIVYRDREEPVRRPRGDPDARNSAQEERDRAQRDWKEQAFRAAAEAMERQAEARRRRHARAFDDAEMSDEERAERRAKKEADKKSRFGKGRELLQELIDRAAENLQEGYGALSNWEISFADSVPYEVESDVFLSKSQEQVCKRIIAKVKAASGWHP